MNNVEIRKLTPVEFEILIANLFKELGYTVKHISLGEDIGIDIIAIKNAETLAIQVKKYIRRKINLAMVYHTFGAATYYECSKAIIVTLNELTANAEVVASKLKVEIWGKEKLFSLLKTMELDVKKVINKDDNNYEDWFYNIWDSHIKSLEGRKIKHLTQNTYIIITKVDDDGVSIVNSKGRKRSFDIAIFHRVLTKFRQNGYLTRQEINDDYQRRGASAISAILATIPTISKDNNAKKTTLVWTELD